MSIDLIYIHVSVLLSCFSKSIGFSIVLLTLFNIIFLWPHLQNDGSIDIVNNSQSETIHILKSFIENKKHEDHVNFNATKLYEKLLQVDEQDNDNTKLFWSKKKSRDKDYDQNKNIHGHRNHVSDQRAVVYYFILFTLVGKNLSVCLYHPPLIHLMYMKHSLFYCFKIIFSIFGFISIGLLPLIFQRDLYTLVIEFILNILWSVFCYYFIIIEDIPWQTKKSIKSLLFYFNIIYNLTSGSYLLLKYISNETISETMIIHCVFIIDIIFILYIRLKFYKHKKIMDNMKLFLIDEYNMNMQRNFYLFIPNDCDLTMSSSDIENNSNITIPGDPGCIPNPFKVFRSTCLNSYNSQESNHSDNIHSNNDRKTPNKYRPQIDSGQNNDINGSLSSINQRQPGKRKKKKTKIKTSDDHEEYSRITSNIYDNTIDNQKTGIVETGSGHLIIEDEKFPINFTNYKNKSQNFVTANTSHQASKYGSNVQSEANHGMEQSYGTSYDENLHMPSSPQASSVEQLTNFGYKLNHRSPSPKQKKKEGKAPKVVTLGDLYS